MIRKKLTDLAKIEKLTDTLVDDILNMSDEEVITEAKEQFEDPQAEIKKVRDIVQSALMCASKSKLAKAQAAVAAHKKEKGISNVIELSTFEKKAVIDRFVRNDPDLNEKVTLLAARKGEGIRSENDIEDMFDDLIELGLIDKQGNPQ